MLRAAGLPRGVALQLAGGAEAEGARAELRMERWRDAYGAMAEEAVLMGIPRDVIPPLPPHASEAQLRDARDHLSGMMASFMSASL